MRVCTMPVKPRERNPKYTALSLLAVTVLWYLMTLRFSPFIVPTIPSVARKLVEICTTKALYSMIGLTIIRLAAGLAIGVLIGVVLGILMGNFDRLNALFSPVIGILQTVPPVSWVVLALVWFGFNGRPTVFIVLTSSIPVIIISVSEGIRNIDERLLDMAKLYHFSQVKTIREVTLPSIGSYFKSAFKVALGTGWKIAVMGEVLTTSDGIGGMIKTARLDLETESIFAWSIVVVLLFYLSDILLEQVIFRGNESLLPKQRTAVCRSTTKEQVTQMPRRYEITNQKALRVSHLTKRFNGSTVIHDMNFFVREGEIVALIGPSGCGKSTLLNIISGLLPCDEGSVSDLSDQLSFVFQDARLLPWRTVYDNVKAVCPAENSAKIHSILSDVGLAGFEDYYPAQLSGGMVKRCGIARAFYHSGNLLLMDEPFSSLDYCLRHEMIEMTRRVLCSHRQSVLFVTHEIDAALRLADRILVLSDRPSTIVEEIQLEGENRDPESHELLEIRRKIIQHITPATPQRNTTEHTFTHNFKPSPSKPLPGDLH